MALQTITRGCSGCLIEAIVRHDEQRLRQLLSADSEEFSDIYWMPRASLASLLAAYPSGLCGFRTLSIGTDAIAEKHCTHLMLEETLTLGESANIALSVVLMSMLHTTGEFNALHVLIESEKFDLSEPLLFHLPYQFDSQWHLILVAVDTIGMAMLIDSGSDIDDPNSFPLLKTYMRSSRLHLNFNVDICLIDIWLDMSGRARWEAIRAHGALSFLYGYRMHLDFLFKSFKHCICGIFSSHGYNGQGHELLLSLLKALCHMGLTLNADTPPAYCYRLNSSQHNNPANYGYIGSPTFLEALIDMFDFSFLYSSHEKVWYVSEWLCNGWICAQKNDWTCLYVLESHHSDAYRIACWELLGYCYDSEVYCRILRQLLALGLFRESENEKFWSDRCFGCHATNQGALVTNRQCPLLMPLVNEFFRKPLSLMKLSRMEIRRLVGMNDFKNRMETLKKMGLLPPLLFEYVWRANEMLVDVALK